MQLQVTLPHAYIELLKVQNGGAITRTAFTTTEKNSWADDHVHLDEIFGTLQKMKAFCNVPTSFKNGIYLNTSSYLLGLAMNDLPLITVKR